MSAWLVTWNPQLYPWPDFAQDLAELNQKGYVDFGWSCGKTRRIQAGERIWLLRLGPRPRGIFGQGTALTAPVEGPSWRDPNRTQMSLEIRWTALLDAHTEQVVLPQEFLKSHPLLGRQNWSPQGSGVSLPDQINVELEKVWRAFVKAENRI